MNNKVKNNKLLCDIRKNCYKRNKNIYVLTYDECKNIIEKMRKDEESVFFGKEKDDSFKGSINNIYQTFEGKDVYQSIEEKAANLLYCIVKNHSFYDGNKRIAVVLFFRFLEKNNVEFLGEPKHMKGVGLKKLTMDIAESSISEKEKIINDIMNYLQQVISLD